ncbi:cytochrome P450 [Micromonospora sp. NPDC047548]|uniref:cytochrome P450 family protein n=1 Tax=Micromonospora sp. NPDC047548 TaxID=3155624 RepID=UPI0033F74A4A
MSELLSLNTSDSGYIRDPYAALTALRDQGPLSRVIVDGLPVWLITGYDEAVEVLSDPRMSNDGRRHAGPEARAVAWTGIATGDVAAHMLRTDPPDHTRLRRLVSKAFTPRRVTALEPRIRTIATDLLAALPTGDEPADLFAAYASPLPILVIGELFGVRTDDLGQFRYWTDVYLGVTEQEGRLQVEASRQLATLINDLFAQRRKELGDRTLDVEGEGTLIDGLIKARDDDDRLDENELITMAFLLLAAGYETTVNLIANGLLILLSEPARLARLIADPRQLTDVIEEFLRFESPVKASTPRYATQDIRVGDTLIPAGDAVLVHFSAANRDPARFADSDAYDPQRNAEYAGRTHLAFGYGLHYCLGASLARLEARVAFEELLAAHPDMGLALSTDQIEWRRSRAMRGVQALPVRLRRA